MMYTMKKSLQDDKQKVCWKNYNYTCKNIIAIMYCLLYNKCSDFLYNILRYCK